MYRNNFIFTFSNFGDKSEIGIYKKKRSRELIPCDEIEIAFPPSKLFVRIFLDWLISNKLDQIYDFNTDNGFLHNISIRNNTKNELMIELYLHNNPNIKKFINQIKRFPFSEYNIISVYVQIFDKHHNFRDEFSKIHGNDYLDYHFGDKIISIYPGAFLQTNNDILFGMYDDIIKNMNRETNIFFDLYCGVGVMSILVSDHYVKCYGVEINANSIDMANINAKKNDITNTEFICSPVEDIISRLINQLSEQVVIFINPPRSGLKNNVIEELNSIKKHVKQIIYLSCSEKTLNRDLELFNYSYEIMNKYNMFPETGHIETCVLLS